MPKAAEPLDWPTIQALYTTGRTAESIAQAITSDPSQHRKISSRIRTMAARKQWKAKAQALIQGHRMTTEASSTQQSITTANEQTKHVLSHPGAENEVTASSVRAKMVLGLLEDQKKRYLANGATLAGTVLERAAKQAESGALPADPEQLRAIGEALLPFHRIGRDVFGLGGERAAGPQVQVNIATLSDARDVQVVEVE